MPTIIDEFLFFAEEIAGDLAILGDDELRHLVNVLRIKAGSIIFVTDGAGYIYTCILEAIEKKGCVIRIHEKKIQDQLKPRMHFCIGLPEKEAFETVLTELVPLGVVKIIPVVCTFCQKKWWTKKWNKHFSRFQKKMITATKQSWNAWLPKLDAPVTFKQALDQKDDLCLFGGINGIIMNNCSFEAGIPEKISCFIGPPGGFSPEEIEKLKASGANEIKLANHRLRTELAATIMASCVVQQFSTKK